MTDLEENCWSESLCQNCGSQLRGEQKVLVQNGTSSAYCSNFCYDQALKVVMPSAPIFVAPPRMDLIEHLRGRRTR
jgi:hypothetical protein